MANKWRMMIECLLMIFGTHRHSAASRGRVNASRYTAWNQSSKYPEENKSTNVFASSVKSTLGITNRQDGFGPVSWVGVNRPTSAAFSFGSNSTQDNSTTAGPLMSSARIGASCGSFSTSESVKILNRPGTSRSNHKRPGTSGSIRFSRPQNSWGMVIRRSGPVSITLGWNGTSPINSHYASQKVFCFLFPVDISHRKPYTLQQEVFFSAEWATCWGGVEQKDGHEPSNMAQSLQPNLNGPGRQGNLLK
jgi:hypothetical protein